MNNQYSEGSELHMPAVLARLGVNLIRPVQSRLTLWDGPSGPARPQSAQSGPKRESHKKPARGQMQPLPEENSNSLTSNSSSLSSSGLSTSCLLSSLQLLYMTTNPFTQADKRLLLQECSSSEFSSTLEMASATVQLQKYIFKMLHQALCVA